MKYHNPQLRKYHNFCYEFTRSVKLNELLEMDDFDCYTQLYLTVPCHLRFHYEVCGKLNKNLSRSVHTGQEVSQAMICFSNKSGSKIHDTHHIPREISQACLNISGYCRDIRLKHTVIASTYVFDKFLLAIEAFMANKSLDFSSLSTASLLG